MKHQLATPTTPAWVVIDKDYVIDIEPVVGWSFCNGDASPIVAMQVNGERLPVGNKTLVGDLDGLEEAVSGLLTSRASRLQFSLRLRGVRFLVDGEEANPWEHDLTVATVEVPTKKVAFDHDEPESSSTFTSGVLRYLAGITAGRESVLATRRLDAACRGMDPAIFYAERGMPTAEARVVCAECPVAEPCPEFALENSENFGFWGGRSVRDRRRIRRQRREGAAA